MALQHKFLVSLPCTASDKLYSRISTLHSLPRLSEMWPYALLITSVPLGSVLQVWLPYAPGCFHPCFIQDPLNLRLHQHWEADSGSRLGMGGCVCHVVLSGSQVVDQGAGATGISAASGPASHVQLPLQPSFLCCGHCRGQGSPSHVSASTATSGFSGAAVLAAMVGRPGLQAPTPLVPRFCLFSVLHSNHFFFLFHT